MHRTPLALGLLFSLALLPACQTGKPVADAEPKPPSLSEWDSFRPESERERAYIGAQPSPAALAEFKERGGRVVINMRTEPEMAMLPYYEELVESLGLTYVHVPTKGSEMGPEQYDQIRAALDTAEGPVMLHCGSGGRATYMWGAHLTQAEGKSPAEAKAWCSTFRDGKVWEGGEAAIDRVAGTDTATP